MKPGLGQEGAWGAAPSMPAGLSPGVSGKPSLLSQQGPVMTPGQNLTLPCHSGVGHDRFALTQDEGRGLPQSLVWQPQAHIPLGPVRPSHRGRYRCYGGHSLTSEWSAPRDPLDVLVAGEEPVGQSGAQTLHRPCRGPRW